MGTFRELLRADMSAMAEGQPISKLRLLLRLAVHARWRAVVGWRISGALMSRGVTRPLALLLTDRILAASGAELQPGAVAGPGLVLKHTTGIVVGNQVVAGARLTLHQNVTLGDRRPYGGQPHLGDDVIIGAGACVLGPITVGDRVIVAANAVVLEDVPSDSVVAGVPARAVRRTGIEGWDQQASQRSERVPSGGRPQPAQGSPRSMNSDQHRLERVGPLPPGTSGGADVVPDLHSPNRPS